MMNEKLIICPVCLNANGSNCNTYRTGCDSERFICDACGQFEVSRTAMIDCFNPNNNRYSTYKRAALSHRIRVSSAGQVEIRLLTDWVDRFMESPQLPIPTQQVTNLIKYIGDMASETGVGIQVESAGDVARIGVINFVMLAELLNELERRGIIKSIGSTHYPNFLETGIVKGKVYGLTLEGWGQYEKQKHGRVSGVAGFLAMKFGDPTLDRLANESIKPEIKTQLGYGLVDLRDVPRAGIIDNIMREQIRDAAFVLVDLTHDNSGAYWEAGYAEGLGKPVIYLCEQLKFDERKTHFDTNHCTTVPWNLGAVDDFLMRLIATLRRSLNLF